MSQDKIRWVDIRVKWPDGRESVVFINVDKAKKAEITLDGDTLVDLLGDVR